MASITFVLPALFAKHFTGGTLTVCNYANGLARRGHQVAVATLHSAERPTWINVDFDLVTPPERPPKLWEVLCGVLTLSRSRISRELDEWARGRLTCYVERRAQEVQQMKGRLPLSEVTVATSYETALPVWAHASGRKFYFLQHFEPLFANERSDARLADLDARASYFLPEVHKIANSTWLSGKIAELTGVAPPVCLSAIDHATYSCTDSERDSIKQSGPPVVISYGGRGAEWKGIRDAARAIRIARREIPDLRWKVFGPCDLKSDNETASFEDLGFITGRALRDAYVGSDMLLAPSWYESFPLFPLEAMSAGIAVVTTPYGVEDYATHGKNCLVVPPKSPEKMAEAILRCARDNEFRARISRQAYLDARELTWARSVERMEGLLLA